MIHPTAELHPECSIGQGSSIGPFAVIGRGVTIGKDCAIGSHAVLEGNLELGDGATVHPHAVLGATPQDLKYKGEPAKLIIGEGSIFREGSTVNCGSGAGGATVLGPGCYLMANAHVGHDCRLGREVILANSVALAGHVTVGDFVNFGGLAGVHQFVRIGAHAFIAAGAMVRRDIPPYAVAKGDRARITGINRIGLERRGFKSGRISKIEEAYAALASHGLEPGMESLRTIGDPEGDIASIISFIEGTELGISLFGNALSGQEGNG